MSLSVIVIPVTAYQQNCSLLICDKTRRAALVDPGGDSEHILSVIQEQGVSVQKILITHGHIDHAGAAKALAQQLAVPIEGPHKDDLFWLDKLPETAQMMHFPESLAFVPDRWLEQGDSVQFGEIVLQVLHCPGHTPGHVVFYHPESQLAWVGDVLFQGSIGRTDFPRGNYDDLVDSIRHKLWPLGDEITFVPGHGPTSTFGEERQYNAFVADSRFG